MKVCANNRKPLAWLAIGALEEAQAGALRAHLEACPGCRDYLRQIERAARQLREAEAAPVAEPSPFFHQRLRHALREAPPRPIFGWRLALPALALAVVLLLTSRPLHVAPAPRPAPVASAEDMDMTILNYQIAADQSVEKLDRLLTEQANRGLPAAPLYRAGSLLTD